VINPGGTVTYTPDPNYAGTDTFTYTICEDPDSAVIPAPEDLCVPATVRVTVDQVNDAPVVTTTLRVVVVGDEIPALEISDIEGDGFVVSILSGVLPPGVTLGPGGTFTGSPSVTGIYTLTLEVCDDGVPAACETVILTIDVLPPVLASPDDPDSVPASLPRTGMDSGVLTMWATVLLALGSVLVLIGRRRPGDRREARAGERLAGQPGWGCE
jgi:LPXTG-motif cell wall-anchored protein